jgi:pimeloyl-ACP methyl ester carboxylesterase
LNVRRGREPGGARALRSRIEERLPEVRARALVAMGTKDGDFDDPAAGARLVAARVQGDLAMVEGAGHDPHVEYSELLAGAA